MQSWIKNPTMENAKMYGAVRRFGLMQKQAFPEEVQQKFREKTTHYHFFEEKLRNLHSKCTPKVPQNLPAPDHPGTHR